MRIPWTAGRPSWPAWLLAGPMAAAMAGGLAMTPGPVTAAPAGPAVAAPQLHVSGNRLVGANGRPVVLHGVNRSGGEFRCVQGHGIWDGPMNQASLTAMRAWHVNAVRVPLNEACWNGQSYVRRQYRGASYRRAVAAYVRLLNSNGMVAILDLQWTDGAYTGATAACRSAKAVCQKPMPDAAHAIPFWKSVAGAFKGNNAVIFDLFNEAFPQAALGEAAGWQCWSRGGSACPAASGFGYQVAGMQSLVHAVRSAGARNVLLVGGLWWANDLTQWLRYRPSDPDHELAASWHSYNFNACSSPSCWNSQVAPVLAKVPVVVGEIGEKGCTDSYLDPLMKWLDARFASYLAWAWNADFSCSGGPSLITSYSGTPTPYGRGYRSHLLSLP